MWKCAGLVKSITKFSRTLVAEVLDLEMAEEWGKIPRLVSSLTSKNKDEKSRT